MKIEISLMQIMELLCETKNKMGMDMQNAAEGSTKEYRDVCIEEYKMHSEFYKELRRAIFNV
jgi:hypothetical protein